MRLRKKLLCGLGVAVGCILLFVLWLYVQASRDPVGYRPLQLPLSRRDEAMRDFAKRCQELYNDVQRRRAFEWRITEERLNEYLDSMDEIASGLPGGISPGQVAGALREAGLGDMALALDDGCVTLMARSIRWRKVISVSLGIEFPEPGTMQVRFLGARVGRVRLPRKLALRALDRIKAEVGARVPAAHGALASDPRSSSSMGLSSGDLARLLGGVVLAIDERPISTSLQLDRKRICITDVQVTEESMLLLVEPVGGTIRREVVGDDEGWPAEFNLR